MNKFFVCCLLLMVGGLGCQSVPRAQLMGTTSTVGTSDTQSTPIAEKKNYEGVPGGELGVDDGNGMTGGVWYSEYMWAVPKEATSVKVISLDLNGDGTDEKVVYYKIKENVGDVKGLNQYRTNEHIKILRENLTQWELIKDDIAPNDNVAVETFYDVIAPITLNSQKFLLVSKKGMRSAIGYYVVGNFYGGIQEMEVPKGYLDPNQYLTKKEQTGCTLYYNGVTSTDNGIREYYDVGCGEYDPRFDQPERFFTVLQQYDGHKFVSQVETK